MLYQRSHDIEKRLAAVLSLIRQGQPSTPILAAALEVSIPTVSRDITALRQRGYGIVAGRRPDGSWGYSLRKPRGRPSRNPKSNIPAGYHSLSNGRAGRKSVTV
jgi:biotin operon repressor